MSTEFLQTEKSQRKRLDSCHTVEIRDVWEHAEGNKCAASGAHGRGGSHHARLPLFFHGSHVGLTPGLLLTVSSALFPRHTFELKRLGQTRPVLGGAIRELLPFFSIVEVRVNMQRLHAHNGRHWC